MTRGSRLLRTAVGLWVLVVAVFAFTITRPPVFNGLTILNIMLIALALWATAKGLRLHDEAKNGSHHGK